MADFPNWDRPALTERQLVGEEKRLRARGLSLLGVMGWPERVRADLIVAAAHQDGVSRTARLEALAECIQISPAYPDNFLSGRLPAGDALLDALYGPFPGCTLPAEWQQHPAQWGPMLPDAIAAGLVEQSGFVDTTEPTNPDPGAGGFTPTVVPPAPVIVADPTPSIGNDLPAAPATPCPAPELGHTASADQGAPPAFSSEPVPQRAPEADGSGIEGEGARVFLHLDPAQPRDVPAAAGQPLPAPTLPPSLIFTAPPERVRDPMDPALDVLLQLAQDAEREAKAARSEMAELHRRLRAAEERGAAAAAAFKLLVDVRHGPADAGERAAA